MGSVADIWNQALGLIGVGDEVQDPDAETSKEAAACRRFWPDVRDQVLRDFWWPRLKVTQALQLVAAAPNGQWAYSYRMPNKCAAVRRLKASISPRIDSTSSAVRYEFSRDESGDLIFTDLKDAQIEFTYQETQTGRYTADMSMTMALLLASAIGARFGPEAVKLADRALRLYEWRRGTAQANAANEVQPDEPNPSDFENARNA